MATFKDQVIHPAPVGQKKTVQLMRYRKYHMVILRRQQFTHTVIDPLITFQSTTIGTMTVAAAVILIVPVTAMTAVTLHDVIPLLCSVTLCQPRQYCPTVWIVLTGTWMVEYEALQQLPDLSAGLWQGHLS